MGRSELIEPFSPEIACSSPQASFCASPQSLFLGDRVRPSSRRQRRRQQADQTDPVCPNCGIEIDREFTICGAVRPSVCSLYIRIVGLAWRAAAARRALFRS